jgi:nitrite reductase/ring-hydroxylating ferredoxin subunit
MRAEDNELLTRVGPGTPMGEFMRCYWFPVAKSSELEAGGAPVRMRVLGENFLAFRSPEGDVGVIDHMCAHRCASLFYGRNESGGMRCVYHGWKFDVTGQCIEMPSEPPETQFAEKVKVRAATVKEKYGIVWAYFGKGPAPAFPKFDLDHVDEKDLEVTFLMRECNWLQGLEADIDTVHVGFLHMGGFGEEYFEKGSTNYYRQTRLAPKYEAIETIYGTMYSAYRPAAEGELYHRVGQLMFPSFTMAAQDPLGTIKLRSWVPLDDEHCMLIVIDGPRPISAALDKDGKELPGLFGDGDVLPNTNEWLGRYRMAQNPSNDHMLSREAQRTVNFSGIIGGRVQDQAIVESMGPIADRTKENLGTSDQMIIRTRRRMIRAVRAYAENGTLPPGVEDASLYSNVRSGYVTLPASTDWLDKMNEVRREWADGNAVPVIERELASA